MAVSPLTVFAGTEAEDGQNDAASAEAVLDDSAAAEEQAEPAEAPAEEAEAAETAEAVPEEETFPAQSFNANKGGVKVLSVEHSYVFHEQCDPDSDPRTPGDSVKPTYEIVIR